MIRTLLLTGLSLSLWPAPIHSAPNPDQVAAALRGELQEVNLGWWPDLDRNATEAFHQAFASGARRIVVPDLGKPYIVHPLHLSADHQEIVLERGVEILAAPGAFQGRNDSLLSIVNRKGIHIIGHGATLRMRKADYQKPPYAPSKWRMGISIQGSEDVTIEGLTVAESGGDGIYIAPALFRRPPYPDNSIKIERQKPNGEIEKLRAIVASRKIPIRGVTATGNHRQGLSLISGEDIVIEDCLFEETRGNPPASGLDIEPNSPTDLARNVIVRNCVAKANEGHGFLVYLRKMKRITPPVSITFEGCTVLESEKYGLVVGGIGDHGVEGQITFRNCEVRDTRNAGIYLFDKSVNGAHVTFDNCRLENVATAKQTGNDSPEAAITPNTASHSAPVAPIVLYVRRLPDLTQHIGGITFRHCTIADGGPRPVILAGDRQGKREIQLISISGTLYVPAQKPPLSLGPEVSDFRLKQINAQ